MTMSIDGGGVFPDIHLPAGARIRVSMGEPQGDVSIFVKGDRIHVVGQYGRVITERTAPNYLEIFTIVPTVRAEDAA